MQKNRKQTVAIILIDLGIAMLAYGLSLHVMAVYSENNDKGFATAETVIMREVSIGGLERNEAGNLHKTYTGKPPQACPT